MIPNNNLSVLPWYSSIEQQNARKWWAYGRIYPLYVPAGTSLPFQFTVPSEITGLWRIYLYNANTNVLVQDCTNAIYNSGMVKKEFTDLGYYVMVYPGELQIFPSMPNGRYYFVAELGTNRLYSEIFTVVNDIEPYLKIEWWDLEDLVMDAGAIVYKFGAGSANQFKNVLYLQADIAKPEYVFEEEGETRDGYFYPIKQISEKRYRFNFLASEYLLDVMRFIRMSDFVRITKGGQTYDLDTFLLTPEWGGNGDIANVEVEFDTATVAKKIGRGYIRALRGDLNSNFETQN